MKVYDYECLCILKFLQQFTNLNFLIKNEMFRKNITNRLGNMVSLPILPVHQQEEKKRNLFF